MPEVVFFTVAVCQSNRLVSEVLGASSVVRCPRSGMTALNQVCSSKKKKLRNLSNGNWTEWSTLQGVIGRCERVARGRFKNTSAITPECKTRSPVTS